MVFNTGAALLDAIVLSVVSKEKDGTYYWYINKDNYINKNINIEFEKNENTIELDENGYFSSNIIKYIII